MGWQLKCRYNYIPGTRVNPTYEDNYPTTNLESIACGTPVISFDTGGSGESAKIFGEVVPKGDILGLWEKIQNLASIDKQLIDKKVLDKEKMTSNYIKLYS